MSIKVKKRQQAVSRSVSSKRRRVDTSVGSGIFQLKSHHAHGFTKAGTVLTLGVGDTGQLGLGPSTTERTKPAKFPPDSILSANLDEESVDNFVQVVAGGMHTLCLTADGSVFSFGCNDEGVLGRPSTDTSMGNGPHSHRTDPVEESRPGIVIFPEKDVKIKMISAGDSHSAALDVNGCVWVWGTFRGASGAIGLIVMNEICRSPVRVSSLTDVVKIASGQDHLVCLTNDGRLLTMGCGEQGQLGRIAERFAKDGGRNGLDLLLQPGECRLRGSRRFVDVWAGGCATIARCIRTGVIYACGLNNYGQLSFVKQKSTINERTHTATTVNEQLSESLLTRSHGPLVQFMLTPARGFEPDKKWIQFALGMHHTVALTASGDVYAVGRIDYGRLGFFISQSPHHMSEVSDPRPVQGALCGRSCSWVGCGEACSFAVDYEGKAFSWGMGSNQQLAHAVADKDSSEPDEMLGKNLLNKRVIMIDAGGQHTVMLAHDPARRKTDSRTVGPVAVEGDSKPASNVNTANVTPVNSVSTSVDSVDSSANPKHLSTMPTFNSLYAPLISLEDTSTAGATVNSSSLHSCSLVASDRSSLSSAHSTDGGGSSRLGGSLFAQPVDTPTPMPTLMPVCLTSESSIASTSEPGFSLNDGASMTASSVDTH